MRGREGDRERGRGRGEQGQKARGRGEKRETGREVKGEGNRGRELEELGKTGSEGEGARGGEQRINKKESRLEASKGKWRRYDRFSKVHVSDFLPDPGSSNSCMCTSPESKGGFTMV